PTATFLHALTQPSSFDPVTPPVFAEPAPIPEMPWKTNPATGHLKGFIQNVYTGRPIDGATVHLAGPETRAIQTDATGFYAFVDLPPGNYTATAVWSESETAAPETMLSIAKGEVIHQNLSFSVPGHIPGPLVEIVVDNEDPAVTYTGDWQISDNP